MNYKILINESGVPVLVEVPEPERKLWFRSEATPADNIAALKKMNSEALSAALADKSKHIAFKDENKVAWMLLDDCTKCAYSILPCDQCNSTGKYFSKSVYDLPENTELKFEAYCEKCGSFNVHEFLCGNVNCKQAKLAILTPITEAPSPSQVLTAEEIDNDLVEKFMAIIPLADPGFVENLAFECSKVAKKYSTLQTQQLQNRVKELEEANKEARNEALQEAQDALTRRGFINTDAHHNGKIVHYELEKLKK